MGNVTDTAPSQTVTRSAETRWSDLASSDLPKAFSAWLSILVSKVEAQGGYLVLGPADRGPFRPVAACPEKAPMSNGVTMALDHAIGERRTIVKSGFLEDGQTSCAIAVPITLGSSLHGAVVLRLNVRASMDLGAVAREAEWSIPAIRAQLLASERQGREETQDRAHSALQVLATALDEERFRVSAIAAVSALAARLDCDRVSYGHRGRNRTKVVALSHSGGFSRKAELMQRIADAMDEAIDQRSVIEWPRILQDSLTVSVSHAALNAITSPKTILTIPLMRCGVPTGAITLERAAEKPFTEQEISLAETAAGFLGPVLEDRRLNDRGFAHKLGAATLAGLAAVFGPRRPALKLAVTAAVAVLLWATLTTAPLRVTADARIEGSQRRVVAAPLDGYIASANVRPGDTVEAGEILALLDDRELALELTRWETNRAQRQREYDAALSQRDRARIGIIASQIGQVDAEIALLKEQIARTRLAAPFAGVVLSGDVDQAVGAPVTRGKVLYELAPLDGVRVILSVPERNIADVRPGLAGDLVLTSLPGTSYRIETGRITSVASIVDGENTFRVEAALITAGGELRPGMQGLAKIEVGPRSLLEIWTRDVRKWLSIALWRWIP